MKHFNLLLKTFFLLCIVTLTITAKAGDKPANADFVVALDGSGDFTSVQAAIDAVPSNNERRTVIYLKRGLYSTEKILVPGNKKNITIIGESREESIISYHIYDCSSGKCPTADAAKWTGDNIRTSATITIMAEGFRAENLTIQNTAGPVGQALAITVQADKCVFVNCDIKSYQDTIYLWTAGKRSYFENCLIVGRTDYIYGAGIGFFNKCEIRSWGGGWITAPSTPKSQPYGYVFYECAVTYATGSPRAGDDGTSVALGRPWHEYPKVAWLYCDMCPQINPLGWPTTWDMSYAATSADLHLYEYKNTGFGADMTGRSNWVGIRALNDEEALNYTIQKVMGGTDNWDPSSEAPAVKSYIWSGNGATASWLTAENWLPVAIPANGESATIDASVKSIADGGTFAADLNLKNGAKIEITAPSIVSYLSVGNGEIIANMDVSFGGKISIKDGLTITSTSELTLNSSISGIQNITKRGSGTLKVNQVNSDYSGEWIVEAGTLDAAVSGSLGNGSVNVKQGAKLVVGNDNALHPKSPLKVATGAMLQLNTTITLSEFYINGVLQNIGTYNASSNPDLISGSGSIVIGRPTAFNFIGGTNGNWDVATSFSPALMPIAGDTVMVAREIETTSTTFPANIILVESKGSLRPRGNHTTTGWMIMQEGTKISYATGGAGFIVAMNEIKINGNVQFYMNTNHSATNLHTLGLPGKISSNGKYTITLSHPRSGMTTPLACTTELGGNNSNLWCDWDVTSASLSASAGAYLCLKGTVPHAFGRGKIAVGSNNKISLDNTHCIGITNDIILLDNAKVILNTHALAKSVQFAGVTYTSGTYTPLTHPAYFEGTGSLSVGATANSTIRTDRLIDISHDAIRIQQKESSAIIYNSNGQEILKVKNTDYIPINQYKKGVYFIKYQIDQQIGIEKFLVR